MFLHSKACPVFVNDATRVLFIGERGLAKILRMLTQGMIAEKSDGYRFAPLAHFSRIIVDFSNLPVVLAGIPHRR